MIRFGRRNQMGGSLARTQIPPALSLAHTYNALNQLKQRGATTLVYDNEGDLTNDGTTTYSWNARGEMTGMTRTGLTASFVYDAFGRRISKTVNGATTKFLYDGADAVQEQNASGAPTANMLIGGTDQVLSRTEGATTRTFQHDGLGSAIGLLDQNGATTTNYAYEPFGATTQTGAANGNASKYTGREDDGTGLYYYRARYYSPTLQRFISEDPIGFAGGDVNLYAYVGNDPINYSDPSGLDRDGGPSGSCGGGGIPLGGGNAAGHMPGVAMAMATLPLIRYAEQNLIGQDVLADGVKIQAGILGQSVSITNTRDGDILIGGTFSANTSILMMMMGGGAVPSANYGVMGMKIMQSGNLTRAERINKFTAKPSLKLGIGARIAGEVSILSDTPTVGLGIGAGFNAEFRPPNPSASFGGSKSWMVPCVSGYKW